MSLLERYECRNPDCHNYCPGSIFLKPSETTMILRACVVESLKELPTTTERCCSACKRPVDVADAGDVLKVPMQFVAVVVVFMWVAWITISVLEK